MDDSQLNSKNGIFHYHHEIGNHMKCFEFMATVTVIALGLMVYMKMEAGVDVSGYFYLWVLVSLLPVLYVYFEYLRFNQLSVVLTIDTIRRNVTYSDVKTSVEFGFDEVKEIVLNRSPSWSRPDRVQMLPFEQFRYAKIFTQCSSITITSLLVRDLEKAIDEIGCPKLVYQTRLFPSIAME